MCKIATAIEESVRESEGGIQAMLDDVAMAVMTLNGGSAVPLWNTWLDGLQEAAPEGNEADSEDLKAMVRERLGGAFGHLGRPGGRQDPDGRIRSAIEAIQACEGNEAALFEAAAQAALTGAERSKDFPSKFGRAKSYGEKTIGTPDAGAVSMACFFKGLAQA